MASNDSHEVVVTVDDRGRANLSELVHGGRFFGKRSVSGVITLEPARAVTRAELRQQYGTEVM